MTNEDFIQCERPYFKSYEDFKQWVKIWDEYIDFYEKQKSEENASESQIAPEYSRDKNEIKQFYFVNKKTKQNPIQPEYYKSKLGVDCIDVIGDVLGIEGFRGFCLGNAIKYIYRAGKKNNELEDLSKATWYMNRYIATKLGIDKEDAKSQI